MKNKIFTRIIITTLLCAFLTFNVGKVTRVSAVGTTIAASAAAALCAVGIVYCSYMALTGASVHVPDTVNDVHEWLQDMGTKVVQYPSGREAYNEIYPQMLSLNPATNLLHDFLDSEVWTWSAAKLRSWANDFSSTDVISSISGSFVDTSAPTTNFTYDFTFIPMSTSLNVNGTYYNDITNFYPTSSYTFDIPSGTRVIYESLDNKYIMVHMRDYALFRNAKHGSLYSLEVFDGTQWIDGSGYIDTSIWVIPNGGSQAVAWLYPQIPSYWDTDSTWYRSENFTGGVTFADKTYPILADADIYDYDTHELIETRSNEIELRRTQWPSLPPEDDNKPVIPYVKLPFDSNWYDPITNIQGGGNWGLNLADLLDELEALAGALMEIGTIADLINLFKQNSGDTNYIYYNEGDDYYYEYYTLTNFGDNIYNYDIDVSEVDEHLPVDLNTIQTYSSNRYLEQIKQSAINGSSIVRDFAVFWYDVDPEITYIALGICVLILLGAFTGKLGHS